MEELRSFLQPYFLPFTQKQLRCDVRSTTLIAETGEVYAWGSSGFGFVLPETPALIKLPHSIRTLVTNQSRYSAYVTVDGRLYVRRSTSPWSVIELPSAVTSVSLGEECLMILTLDGSAYECKCQCEIEQIETPYLIDLPFPACQVQTYSDSYHMVTIDGSMYSFGRNDSGQLGLGNYDDNIGIPRKARVDEPVISVSCGDLHTMILTSSGTVYTCGSNWDAQLGHRDRDLIRYVIVPKPLLLESPCTFIASAGWHNFVILRNGKVYVWGNSTVGELGTDDENLYYPTLLEFEGEVQSIGAGFNHSALLTTDGSVYTCGDVDGITVQSTFTKVM